MEFAILCAIKYCGRNGGCMNIALTLFLLAAPQDQEPTSIIQYRPEYPKGRFSDKDTRQEMADIDKEISQLLQDRQALERRIQEASRTTDALLHEYHAAIDNQQALSGEMRSVDDRISELSRQKAKLGEQLKK